MRALLLSLALLVGGVAAACGGDDGGERLAREEFTQQADAICEEANERVEALGQPSSPDELAAIAAQAVAIQEQALDALRELRPPEDIEERYEQALDLVRQQADLGRELVDAAEEGNQARVTELLAEIEPLNRQADEIAREIGLVDCGSADDADDE